ncbi:MAG: dTDP-4-dehydrorhamnose reductase [Burkholderiales bacterium]
MKVLVIGKSGQLGWELSRAVAPLGSVIATDRESLNLEDVSQIRSRIREIAPDVIINAAAYTDVDRAESEPDRAYAINGAAPEAIADEAHRRAALFVHFSTDYVFDGTRVGAYVEDDPVNPLNVYGASKAFGERAVLAANSDALIIRTSWLYAARGKNFLLGILDRIRRHEPLEIVADQFGAPTYARVVAEAVAALLMRLVYTAEDRRILRTGTAGIYHLTANGQASWFEFALAIREVAQTREGVSTTITANPSSRRRTAARRPLNSRLSNRKFLDTFGFALPDWHVGLHRCFDDLTAVQAGIDTAHAQVSERVSPNEQYD